MGILTRIIILVISILRNAKGNAEYKEFVDTLSGEKSTTEKRETENTVISSMNVIWCIAFFSVLFLCAWMYEEIKDYRIRARLMKKRVRPTRNMYLHNER